MDWLDYREKLKIGFNDEGKFYLLKTKVLNILNCVHIPIKAEEYVRFCNMIGENIRPKLAVSDSYKEIEEGRIGHCVEIMRVNSVNLCTFLSIFVAFINTLEEKPEHLGKNGCISMLETMMNESHIQFDVLQDDTGYYVFPKGVAELDSALVSEPLAWLNMYPSAEKAWSNALRDYAECRPEKASDVADKFRKALETFFKEFFGNDKTLENNKAEYGRYLKSQGVPAEISNNLETLLQAYTHFMNGYAKHHDRTETTVLEYLMYQTGNIMRLLITLKVEAESDAD